MDAYAAFDPRAALYAGSVQTPNYGAEYDDESKMTAPVAYGRGIGRKLDGQSMVLAFLVPVALFTFTFLVMCLRVTFEHPGNSAMLIILAFFFVFGMGLLSIHAINNWRKTGTKTWHLFIILTSLLACALGTLLGYLNFSMFSDRYYEYISLRRVVDVDPIEFRGQQVMDAGEVDFKLGTHIDRTMNMMYYKRTAYCIAPLVSKDGLPLAQYDFWAVGKDCCSSRQGDFTCGPVWTGWGNAHAIPSGLRVLEDADIQGYTLALEQAKTAYNIQSQRPIFLEMTKKPYLLIKAYWTNAQTFAIVAIILYAVVQAALIAAQAYMFGKGQKSGYLDLQKTGKKFSLI